MSLWHPQKLPKEVAKEVWIFSPRYKKFIKDWLFMYDPTELGDANDFLTFPSPTLVKRAGSTFSRTTSLLKWTTTETLRDRDWAFFPFPTTPRSIYIYAWFRTSDIAGIGIGVDESNIYLLELSLPYATADFRLCKYVAGSVTELAIEAVDLVAKKWYLLEIVYNAFNGRIQVYRDGEKKFDLEDVDVTPNKFFFEAYQYTGDGQVHEIRTPCIIWSE